MVWSNGSPHRLDAAEGLHNGYRDEILEVIAGARIYWTRAYVATDKRQELPVFDWYLDTCFSGQRRTSCLWVMWRGSDRFRRSSMRT